MPEHIPPARPVIELREVSKIYQLGSEEVPALKDISIAVNKGEFVALLGPSGSGKSTLMNLVGCLSLPTHGTILLEGKDIANYDENELAQIRGKKIGFIFQKFHLISTLTALQNVMLPMTFQGRVQEEREQRARESLAFVGLAHRLNHKANELSGGEQQRVAIARALSNDPEIILADEPTGNLDSKTGKKILEILRGLHKQGRTIILITHDQEISSYAERRLSLKDGHLLEGSFVQSRRKKYAA